MIHLVSLNPSLDFTVDLEEPLTGKIGMVSQADLQAGGKALNLSRFFKAWGVKSVLWLGTGGGSDPTHLLYRALLRKEKLTARFLSSRAPIRFNLIVGNKKNKKKYNHSGFEMELTFFPQLYRAVKKGDVIVLTGRLPQGMNPQLYSSWIRAFNRKGVRTLVDTSGKALSESLKSKPWFFKVNLHELSEALGRRITDLSMVPVLKLRLEQGAVTDGAHGAVVWDGGKKIRVQYSGKIKSGLVVGAGDAFLAGYLKGWVMKKSLNDRVRLACAAGAVVAEKGINGFAPKLVSAALRRVSVRELS